MERLDRWRCVYGCAATIASFGLYVVALLGYVIVPSSAWPAVLIVLLQTGAFALQSVRRRRDQPMLEVTRRWLGLGRVGLRCVFGILLLHVVLLVALSNGQQARALWASQTALAALLLLSSVHIALTSMFGPEEVFGQFIAGRLNLSKIIGEFLRRRARSRRRKR